MFASIEGFQATRIYCPNDLIGKALSSGRMVEKIYAFEVEAMPETELCITLCVYQRRPKSSSGFSSVYDWAAFGFPQIIRIRKSYLSTSQWKACVIRSLTRFVDRSLLEKLLESVQPKPENCANSEHLSDSSDNSEGSNVNGDDDLFTLVITNPIGTAELSSPFRLSEELPDYGGDPLYLAVTWSQAAERKLKDNVYRSLNCADYSKRVKHYRNLDLSECLDLFTTTEKLGEYDAWYCPRCKKHQQATKKFDLWNLPKILVVHLKRFSCSRYFHNKIDVLVSFPIRWLINKKEDHVLYDLIGVSNHYGGLGSGHYTACARNCQTNKWYSFDDACVSPIGDSSKIVSKAAYILIYMRQDLPCVSGDPNVEMETD
ncbi:unnamed protein product [Soboliphyme baturini]|uniref:ubiquitinyl hydrolase 1 n=1 Tax=Soboliphyme baturini TaxID=241478 RepID=A0A183I911_9BILA|nr:unnamed protein product [Soboliphyme baturini]